MSRMALIQNKCNFVGYRYSCYVISYDSFVSIRRLSKELTPDISKDLKKNTRPFKPGVFFSNDLCRALLSIDILNSPGIVFVKTNINSD